MKYLLFVIELQKGDILLYIYLTLDLNLCDN